MAFELDFWTLLILNYMVHSTIIILMVYALVKFPVFSELRTRTGLWKFAMIGAIFTLTIQLTVQTSLFKIPVRSEVVSQTGFDDPLPNEAVTSIEAIKSIETSPVLPSTLERSMEWKPNWCWIPLSISILLCLRFLWLRTRFINSLNMSRTIELWVINRFRRLCSEFQIDQEVHLYTSEVLKSPVVISSSKICIPERALHDLNKQELEAMLAHELAHIARRDPAWLMASNLIAHLLFFQPLHFTVRARLRTNMEESADRLAVEIIGDPTVFSNTLLRVARWQQGTNIPKNSLAFAANSGLRERVEAILDGSERKKLGKWTLWLLCILVLGLASFVSPNFSSDSMPLDPMRVEDSGYEPILEELQSTLKNKDSEVQSTESKPSPAVQTNVEREKTREELISLTIDRLNNERKNMIEALIDRKELAQGSQDLYDNLIASTFKNDQDSSGILAEDMPSQVSEITDRMVDMARLADINYEDFKKEFWPMILNSGLLKKRINTVEITYEGLFINNRPVPQWQARSFKGLIEKHFPEEHWTSFQYKRERVKSNRKRPSVSMIQTGPSNVDGASMFRALGDNAAWSQYRQELAMTLFRDGVIDSPSEDISVKWRTGKVFINKKKFTGSAFAKYRSIKNKYFPVRAT